MLDREDLKRRVAELAQAGVFIGTSSWKYPGWCGQIYEAAKYEWRGKFAASRFEKNCLAEYAEIFKTVCVDAAYYTFPKPEYLAGLAAQVTPDFQFGFKVTDAITLKKFPNLPRFGQLAGQPNRQFLDAGVFARDFLKPCEGIRAQVGILIFEFSRFYKTDFEHGRDFIAALNRFLGELPKGWPYGVELRNATWLQPEYFECLRKHNVAHVFNSWTAMPAVGEQLAMPGSLTNPNLTAARFLLKPGRKYEEAVKTFQPYEGVKEIYAEGRQAGADLIIKSLILPKTTEKTFVFINNRLEGNSPQTIVAMILLAWNEYNRRTGQVGTAG